MNGREGIKLFVLVMAILTYFYAYEGNTGKGLACILSPHSLEVTGVNSNDGTAQATSGHSDGGPV